MRPAVIVEWFDYEETEDSIKTSPGYFPATIDDNGNIKKIELEHHFNDAGRYRGWISEYYAMKEAIAYCDGLKELEEKISLMDLDAPLE